MQAQIQRASILSGRQLVLAVTIALHAAAISALLAWRIAEVMTEVRLVPIPIGDVKPDPPHDPPAASSDRDFITTIHIPQPDRPAIPRIDDTDDVIAANVIDKVVTGGAGSLVPERIPVPADTPLMYRATRPADDFYPPQAIRQEVEGVAIVRACVDGTGALSALPEVVKSSRSRLLDAGAIAWAREALQFTPATRAGAGVPACKEFRVNFTLH